MLTHQTPSVDDQQPLETDPEPGTAEASGRRRGRIYLGQRDAGRPSIVVLAEDGSERPLAPALGWFDWGWPSMDATRRLARALLLDATGCEPPTGVRDALLAEELAHFPWQSFVLRAEDLLAWIEARGHHVGDWPPAGAALGSGVPVREPASSPGPFTTGSLASRVVRALVSAPRVAHGVTG